MRPTTSDKGNQAKNKTNPFIQKDQLPQKGTREDSLTEFTQNSLISRVPREEDKASFERESTSKLNS